MDESRNFKVVVTSRETIKPSSSSSSPSVPNHHQRTFKLSLLDQFTPQLYVPFLLFYKGFSTQANEVKEISQRLRSSLSETLTHFYPLAGRFEDHLSFSCNDEGVEYSEAQVLDCSLSGILERPDMKPGSPFLPDQEKIPGLSSGGGRRPLLVQVSFLGCGGMVIGVKFCHMLLDAATCASFVTSWADSATGKTIKMPDFSASTVFPPTNPPTSPQVPPQIQPDWSSCARVSRFVFGQSELAALQAQAASTEVPFPTRFEAISAFLWKTGLLASNNKKGVVKPSAYMWAVNLRSRLQPPLPDNCFGNLVGLPLAHHQGGDIDLPTMALHIKHGARDICSYYVKTALEKDQQMTSISELHMNIKNLYAKYLGGAIDSFLVSSWCNLPFYKADFGWGKPVWVSPMGQVPMPHSMVLTDTSDGLGIEAWVSLMEDEMTAFESNQDLQKYASFNPCAFP